MTLIALDKSSCTDGDIRLWSAYEITVPPNEGIVQICSNRRWTAMCQHSYTVSCHIARTACRSLGYEGAYCE